MNLNPETVAIAVSVVSTLGGGWSFLAQRRTAKDNRELQKQQVESQAYERARAHYDAIIDDLTTHINWLKQELGSATEENTRLRDRIVALEKTVEALRSANVIVIEPQNRGA